uniref:Uncharacterized protein n=1 Tax=Romanomermis culicivorax TaxID=13658 RepID=A0A915ICA0_ROMCU
MSARGGDYQNAFLRGAAMSARGGDYQNAFLPGTVTSARGGDDQYAFPQGAVTSARWADDQITFPHGAGTSGMNAQHPILPCQNTVCAKSTIQKTPTRVMQEKSKSTTNSPRMSTAMALTRSIMSLQSTLPACFDENRNPPSSCAMLQPQDVLTSASPDDVNNGCAPTASSADDFSRIFGSEPNYQFGFPHNP